MALYSNGTATAARLAYLQALASDQTRTSRLIELYREFYRGEHPSQLTARQAVYLNVDDALIPFMVNFCDTVVDSLAERLEVTGISADDEALDETLWKWWSKNGMTGQQILLHKWAARDGLSFLVVSWDNERGIPRLDVNEAWDGDDGIKIHWAGTPHPKQDILFVSKRWTEDFDENGEIERRRRLTLYFPDRVERYVTNAAAPNSYRESDWMPYTDEEGAAWPIDWTDNEGQPLGIPVVPFLNRMTGRSELHNVIPLQIAANKLLIDTMAAADTEGFGIYTKTGGKRMVAPEVYPGVFWQDEDPAAVFGKIGGTNVGSMFDATQRLASLVATVSRRPISYFIPQASSSGEHLKQMESGLVGVAKSAATAFTDAYEKTFQIATRIAATFGDFAADPDLELTIEWADVETRNEEAHTNSVMAKFNAGLIDEEQAWDELGYAVEVQRNMQRRREAKRVRARLEGLLNQPAQPAQEGENQDENQGEESARQEPAETP